MRRSDDTCIDQFEVHRVVVDEHTDWLVLELVTAGGLRGLGEALLANDSTLGAAALAAGARQLIGADCLVGALNQPRLALEQSTGLLEATVHATLDQCLWDLRARVMGVPLNRLLGPARRQSIDLYANINRGTRDRTAEGFATRATAAIGAGFDAVKIAPFDGLTRGNFHTAIGRAAFATAVERVEAVRHAIGEDAALMIDCHCRLDVTSARRFLDATHNIRIDWFEDALPYHDLDGWIALRSHSRVPLVGGETARGTRDLLPFIQRGIWSVLMPDVRFFGGVTELVALNAIAAQHQLTIAPHNPRGPVATLASAQAMVVCPVFHKLEYQFGECDWRADLVGGAERITDGKLQIPDAPGLGCNLNPTVLAVHT